MKTLKISVFTIVLLFAGLVSVSKAQLPKGFVMPKITEPKFADKTFDISKFGAKSDGLTLNTKAIADAIQAANKAGGGTVIFPEGIWLTGPIVLQSNVRLHLEKNSLVTFTKDRSQFPLVSTTFEGLVAYRAQAPISSNKAENIAITGDGIIDGGGDAWRPVKRDKMTESQWKNLVASGGFLSADNRIWYPSESALKGSITGNIGSGDGKTKTDFESVKDFLRPNMVQINESKNVLFQGVTFQNSPAWTLHFIVSDSVTIRGVKVKNPWYGQNNDAVDLESTKNVLLENCIFDTGDDAITLKSGRDEQGRKRGIPTENVLARNMTIYRGHGAFVIGSEMSGGVRNVAIVNSTFIETDVGLRFKTQRGRGGLVEKVFAQNITMKDIGGDAIHFDKFYGNADKTLKEYSITEATPRFQDFHFKDITIQGAKRGIFVRGLTEMNVKNVVMEDLTIQADTGIYSEEGDGFSFKNLTLLTKDTNPVINLLNSKRMSFDNLKFGTNVENLFKISGETSQELRLANTDVSKAKKDFQIATEVPKNILIK